jgi:hypothetical protein
MEENYKLEKEYTVPHETFKEAYKAYQKKYVRPKSLIFTALFLILAADFVYAAVKSPDNRLVYLLIVVCIAMAFREWYNPHRIFLNISETMKALGEPVYKIGIAEDHIDFSTIEKETEDEEEAPEEDETDEEESEEPELPDDFDPTPEKSSIQINESYNMLEYDRFFLLMEGKRMFYIVPKEGFTPEEQEIIRGTKK